jgi:hypothetical protein
MSSRDELRGTLSNTVCNASLYTKRAQPYLLGSDMSAVLDRTADAILAAGYSKPSTIETVEELDALPVETVVRSDMGNIYVKDYDPDDPSAIWWVTAGAVSEFQSNRILLPATVLYEPAP